VQTAGIAQNQVTGNATTIANPSTNNSPTLVLLAIGSGNRSGNQEVDNSSNTGKNAQVAVVEQCGRQVSGWDW
jgi:hypothetical protein